MHQIGASRNNIDQFEELLKSGLNMRDALREIELPGYTKEFVEFTFSVIETKKLHVIASVFTFGREDLIPDMFMRMVQGFRERFPDQFKQLDYYLQRHINVDSDEHSGLALKMVQLLCGEDEKKWEEVSVFAKQALRYRYRLWDGVKKELFAQTCKEN